jgi:iron-sulfur cluster assembly accessory protein
MTITIHPTAVKRISDLRASRGQNDLRLRVIVDGGGCSGFQYKIDLTTDETGDDHVFDGVFITDEISMPYLSGSTVRYDEGLIGGEFVIDNPNAKSGCGCGVSFST